MKVTVGNDCKILYVSKNLGNPILIGYIYEYDADEKDVEYWNSLNPEDRENLLEEAQKGKTDLRLLIKENSKKGNPQH